MNARDLQNQQHPQHLALVDPKTSSHNPALSPPTAQPRPTPYHVAPPGSGDTRMQNSNVRPALPSRGETRMPNGNVVRTAADGSVTDLHSAQHNMSVHYGLNGSRQIRVDQPDGSRIVLASRGVPYMQKPWNYGSRAYDHRTFLNNGQLSHQFYRPYTYGDTTLDVYAPQRFYSQDFYQWVGKPQAWTPPPWTYVTKQESWYTNYQTYFTPQPSYASPVLWLTDFVLAMSLFEAYNAHQLSAHAPPSPPVPVPAPTLQPVAQTKTASVPIVQPPVAQTPGAPAATQAPIVAVPAAAAATTRAPIVALPASSATSAQASIAASPTDAATLTRASTGGASIPEEGATLTLWERFSNFIRGLFGQTPAQPGSAVARVPATPVPAAPVVAAGVAPVTADVKELVADEIGRQIEEESREARGNAQNEEPKPGAGGIVEELRHRSQHVFVVASDLDLVDDTGRRCMISEGDVVQVISAVNAKTSTAQGVVLSSKGGVECAHAATVDIAVSDLQEMQNHMRATIDQGLANTPRGAAEPTVTPAFAAAAPPPDDAARGAIEQQQQIAATVDQG